MSSIAADRQGNVALGYSTSNGTSPNFPRIAYSGRLASDPPNMLPRTETKLIAGAGSPPGRCGSPPVPCPRWGDYRSMSVDPSDGCTFWYTNEYYTSQENGDTLSWTTRIGSFKFPSCHTPRPAPAPPPRPYRKKTPVVLRQLHRERLSQVISRCKVGSGNSVAAWQR